MRGGKRRKWKSRNRSRKKEIRELGYNVKKEEEEE